MKQAESVSLLNKMISGGVSMDALSPLMDPANDPALAMPVFPENDQGPCASYKVPSVDYIEEALTAHVCGGKAPEGLIRSLFGPLKDSIIYLTLMPGKGNKRPSYALEVAPGSFVIERASTRSVAERLHDMAQELANIPVGENAPEDAPEVTIKIPGAGVQGITLRARSLEDARNACQIAFLCELEQYHMKLDLDANQIAYHVLAAREILKNDLVGNQSYRQKAMEIINAMEDLRTVVVHTIRTNQSIPYQQMHWVSIQPASQNMVKVEVENSLVESAHRRVQQAALYRDLVSRISAVVMQHPVLMDLPPSYKVVISGTSKLVSASLLDPGAPQMAPYREIPAHLIEYSKLSELAEALETLNDAHVAPDAQWTLSLEDSATSRDYWSLTGPTLAHAIAQAVKMRGAVTSERLFGLLSDLLANVNGEPVDIEICRVITSV
jgi:hypothetical protein